MFYLYLIPHVYLVCGHVFLDVRLLCEGAATHHTLVRLLPCVRPHVLVQVKVLREHLVAELTNVHLLAFVFRCFWCLGYKVGGGCRFLPYKVEHKINLTLDWHNSRYK